MHARETCSLPAAHAWCEMHLLTLYDDIAAWG